MYAIRAGRDYVTNDDFVKAARKVAENKKLGNSRCCRLFFLC